MTKVVVIINTSAGQNKYQYFAEKLRSILDNKYKNIFYYFTSKPGDAEDLVVTHVWDTDLMVIIGGDGTVYEVMNAVSAFAKRPHLAIIPCGSFNDIARGLKIPENPVEALDAVVNGGLKAIDMAYDGESYFINFWGIGSISSHKDESYKGVKNIFGRLPYFWETYKNAYQAEPFYYECISKHHYLAGRADFILAANGTFTAGFSRVIPRISPNDGLLDIIIVNETRLKTFLSLVKQEIPINEINHDDMIHIQSDKVTIKTSPNLLRANNKRRSAPINMMVLPNHLIVNGE